MTNLGFIGDTGKLAVTDSPNTFTVDAPAEARREFAMTSDVIVFVARNAVASSDDAMRLPANTIAKITMFGGDTLSIVRDTDSGNVWITEIG